MSKAVDRECKTPNQREAVREFNQAIAEDAEVQYLQGAVDEVTAIRFLKAEDFVVQKALARLIANLRWREKHRANTALVAPCYLATQRCYHLARQSVVLGHDRKHNLLVYDGLAHFFLKGGHKLGSRDDMRAVAMWQCEYHFQVMRRLSQRFGHPVWQSCVILDCKGGHFSMVRHIPFVVFLDRENLSYYPEGVFKIIVINVPAALAHLVQKCLACLDPGTVAKVEVHIGLPSQRLLELIPEDQLPPSLGGTSEIDVPGILEEELPGWHDVAAGVQAEYEAAVETRAALPEDLARIAALRAEAGRDQPGGELAYTAEFGKQQDRQCWRAPLSLRVLALALPLLLVLPTVFKLVWLLAVLLTVTTGSPRWLESPLPAAELQRSKDGVGVEVIEPVEPPPHVCKFRSSEPTAPAAHEFGAISSLLSCCVGREIG